jgi:hypothetical protein
VPPDLTVAAVAAPPSVLRPVAAVVVVGLLLIGPAFGWLFALFARHPGGTPPDH